MKNEGIRTKENASALVKVLYVIAAVLMVIFIYMIIVNVMYIKSYADGYGIEVSDMLFDAVQYVVTGSISYFVYGLLVFCAAKIIEMMGKRDTSYAVQTEIVEVIEDADTAEETAYDTEETVDGTPVGEPDALDAADDAAKEDESGKSERKWQEVEIK